MLHRLRSREISAFRHMRDDKNGKILCFAQFHQLVAAHPNLRNAAGRGIELIAVHRLDRVDDQKIRFAVLAGKLHVLHVCLREHIKRLRNLTAYPICPQFDLLLRFLTGDIEHRTAAARDIGRGLHDDRGFADARLARNQHQ